MVSQLLSLLFHFSNQSLWQRATLENRSRSFNLSHCCTGGAALHHREINRTNLQVRSVAKLAHCHIFFSFTVMTKKKWQWSIQQNNTAVLSTVKLYVGCPVLPSWFQISNLHVHLLCELLCFILVLVCVLGNGRFCCCHQHRWVILWNTHTSQRSLFYH